MTSSVLRFIVATCQCKVTISGKKYHGLSPTQNAGILCLGSDPKLRTAQVPYGELLV